ncbi:MFS transporter [Saccharopolyspora sp. NPDC049426]|uniref:MFS transporter n=1 Tax=Saccharopolyspora sp. NPDC049426 TaxID=3155652 RepID=UPI0034354B85
MTGPQTARTVLHHPNDYAVIQTLDLLRGNGAHQEGQGEQLMTTHPSGPTPDAGESGPLDASTPMRPGTGDSGSKRSAMASTVGAIVDWYDFFLYGTAAAVVFGPLYFPSANPLAGLLASMGSFAVAFVFRPIGGAVFGHFGDKVGRKKMLAITVLMMGLASTGIGLLPSYAAIGLAAPVLLVLLRAIQGIAVGGEWGGAALMAVENAPRGKRNFFASGVQTGSFIGLLLGTAAFSLARGLTTDEQFMAWGWRIPFLISIAFALVAFWVRSGVPESAKFKEIAREDHKARAPLAVALRTSPKQILAVIGMRMVDQSTFYIGFTFALAYTSNFTDNSPANVLTASMIAMILAIPSLSLWSTLADRYGRRPFYIAGPILATVAVFPLFVFLENGSLLGLTLSFVALINLGHNISACVQQTWFTDLFDARIRYSGAGFAYALAGAVGGFIPLTATALLAFNLGWYPVAGLVTGLCVLSVVAALWSHRWTTSAGESSTA